MSAPKDDRVYLWDMLTTAKAVVEFTKGKSLAEYVNNLLLRSAVERQIEIIGKAARRISKRRVDTSAGFTHEMEVCRVGKGVCR